MLESYAGVVGIALAMAGADVVLTDLPHVTPLTQENVDANCLQTVHRAQVRSMTESQHVAGYSKTMEYLRFVCCMRVMTGST